VKDLTKTIPVLPTDLDKMVISQPRAPKQKNPSKATSPNTSSTGGRASAASVERTTTTEVSGMSDHKDMFQRSFKTVTLTLGAISGCIRRATTLTSEETAAVERRINDAVHIMSLTRSIVFHGIELYVYKSLTTTVPRRTDELDPLDLLVHKDHGASFVRNLISHILSGSPPTKGPKAKKPATVQAKQLANDVYQELKDVLSDLKPTNPPKNKESVEMPLGIPQADMAVNILTAIRQHFGRLPGLIIKKVCVYTRSSNSPCQCHDQY
jgi:hypothetical protein